MMAALAAHGLQSAPHTPAAAAAAATAPRRATRHWSGSLLRRAPPPRVAGSWSRRQQQRVRPCGCLPAATRRSSTLPHRTVKHILRIRNARRGLDLQAPPMQPRRTTRSRHCERRPLATVAARRSQHQQGQTGRTRTRARRPGERPAGYAARSRASLSSRRPSPAARRWAPSATASTSRCCARTSAAPAAPKRSAQRCGYCSRRVAGCVCRHQSAPRVTASGSRREGTVNAGR